MTEPSDGPYFREKAAHCRGLAASVTDEATRNSLLNLAAEYEQQAAFADHQPPIVTPPKPKPKA